MSLSLALLVDCHATSATCVPAAGVYAARTSFNRRPPHLPCGIQTPICTNQHQCTLWRPATPYLIHVVAETKDVRNFASNVMNVKMHPIIVTEIFRNISRCKSQNWRVHAKNRLEKVSLKTVIMSLSELLWNWNYCLILTNMFWFKLLNKYSLIYTMYFKDWSTSFHATVNDYIEAAVIFCRKKCMILKITGQ